MGLLLAAAVHSRLRSSAPSRTPRGPAGAEIPAPLSSYLVSARSTVASGSRTAAALLRRQFLGIGVARCRRPGQFDERHDPPTGAVKLANDEALLLDVGQQAPCTAQRM